MNARDGYDALIVGGGPGATITALYLLRHGLHPLIIERDSFPRYHIGESLTGECGNHLRRLGLEAYMEKARYPVKYGVAVWGPRGKNRFWVPVLKRGADGELHENTTWQVRRAEFDAYLLETAIERGAAYLQATADDVIRDGDRIAGLTVTTPAGETRELRGSVVVDASGQATFLANRGVTGPKRRGRYDRQVAFFSQVEGALRDEGAAGGNTLIFHREKSHWAWFIPLDDAVTSIGIVVPNDYWREQGLSREDFFKREVHRINPALTRRIEDVAYTEPVRAVSNYSYEVERYTGKGFLCVGDSHRFVDPVFSFGVFFAAEEGYRAAQAIKDYCDGRTRDLENPFAGYERTADRGQRVIQDLVDCFWDFPLAFQRMAHNTHQEDIADCFAGRVYQEEDALLGGVRVMRDLVAGRSA